MPATRIGESFPGVSPGAGFESAMGQCTPNQHSPVIILGADKIHYRDKALS